MSASLSRLRPGIFIALALLLVGLPAMGSFIRVPVASAACLPPELAYAAGPYNTICSPGAGVVGAVAAAASHSTKANLARAAAASCPAITAGNVGSLVITGSGNMGFGRRIRWSSASNAFYTIANNEIARYDAASLARTVVYSGATQVEDFSPDSGLTLLGTNGATTLQVFDVVSQTVKTTITASAQYGSAAISPDGSLVTISLLPSIAEEVRSTANGALVGTFTGFSTGAPVYSATFAPDGKTLLWVSRARVQQMTLATGVFGPVFSHEDFVFDTSLADNKLATAFGEGDAVWDLTTGAKLWDFRPAVGGSAAALTRDGNVVFVGNKAEIDIYSTVSGSFLTGYSIPGSTLALSPDNCKLVAVNAADGSFNILAASAAAPASPIVLPPSGTILPPNTGDGGLR